jgi:hypothetical protein
MGYDISYHPVDLAFLHERVIPFIRGERTLDDLQPAALRIAKVHFRANAWGLGVLKLDEDAPDAFDSDLHVWGRPFFITSSSSEEVSDAIDRYLAADEEQVDDIAAEMLRQLDPGLLGRVSPDSDGELPDDVAILHDLFWKLDLFRKAYAALKSGQKTVVHAGKKNGRIRPVRDRLSARSLQLRRPLSPGVDVARPWLAKPNSRICRRPPQPI